MCPHAASVTSAPVALPWTPAAHLRLAGDERLARLAGEGSETAFAILFQRFSPPLYRYCRSLLGNDADAQDALQTTFTLALVALREDRRTAPVRPWLYRIAHNESISLLRRRRQRPIVELPEDGGGAAGPSLEEVVDQRSRLHTLVADLDELATRQRGALIMRELSGLAHEEIAQALGISVGAAKQTVLEARRSLQEFEEGRSMTCEQIQRVISDSDRRTLHGRRVRAHLRECRACRTFAEAIPARRAELRALCPALPAATAAGLLARITGTGPGQTGGAAGIAAGATAKAVGLAASTKMAITGAAVVAAAALGSGEIHHLATRPTDPANRPAPAASNLARAGRPRTAITGSITVTPPHWASPPATPSTARQAAGDRAGTQHASGRRGQAHHRKGHAVADAADRTAPSGLHGKANATATGQGATHRATPATPAHALTGPSGGHSAAAPGYTRQTGHDGHTALQAHTAPPATTRTHGNSSHTTSGRAVQRRGAPPSTATPPAAGQRPAGHGEGGNPSK